MDGPRPRWAGLRTCALLRGPVGHVQVSLSKREFKNLLDAKQRRGKETKELFLLGFFAALRPKDFVFYPFLFAPLRLGEKTRFSLLPAEFSQAGQQLVELVFFLVAEGV